LTRPPDPILRVQRLIEDARDAGAPLPEAMSLATVSGDVSLGAPSLRMVILRGADPRGFVFFTSANSRKGHDLRECPRAALCFWWPQIDTQVRIEGAVDVIADAEADAYFATRPRDSQIGAWASRQSETLDSREALEADFAAATARFDGIDVPRPPFWKGYRVIPTRIEFWHDRPGRLHDRLLYERDGLEWRTRLLYP